MENASPSPTQSQADYANRYDLFDKTIEAFERDLAESKQDAPELIKAWLGPLRDEGYPAVAFELERLLEAIRGGNVPEIRESLVKAARLSEDALGKADGMFRAKLLDMVNLMKAAASQFDTEE